MARMLALVTVVLACLSGCTTAADRKAAESAQVKKEAAEEINRICSLPEPERSTELKKLEDEHGMVLHCGSS